MTTRTPINRSTLCLLGLRGSMLASAVLYAQAGSGAPTEKALYVEKTRGMGQCEIFLLKGTGCL